jgi:drug/metabolite transporter (DMT)-like permease
MRYLPAVIVDALLVLVFAVIGRASHDENPAGFLLTAWPFLVALLLGHLLAALLPARPRRPWSILWGAVVWVVTVVGGLLLRVLSGDTAQVPFIIVATLTLGLLLVGWRGVAALVRRSRSQAAATDDAHADDASTDAAIDDVTSDDAAIDDAVPTRRDDDPVA